MDTGGGWEREKGTPTSIKTLLKSPTPSTPPQLATRGGGHTVGGEGRRIVREGGEEEADQTDG